MKDGFQAAIESYLYDRADWVPVADLVAEFHLPDDRYLRADGRIPGPLSRCAIFSSSGVKHIAHATLRERIACRNRLRRELISRVRRIRWLEQGIAMVRDGRWERHTKQGVLGL